MPKPVPQNYKGYSATKPQAYDVISRKSEETPTKMNVYPGMAVIQNKLSKQEVMEMQFISKIRAPHLQIYGSNNRVTKLRRDAPSFWKSQSMNFME